jgi:hypothetical protein
MIIMQYLKGGPWAVVTGHSRNIITFVIVIVREDLEGIVAACYLLMHNWQ